MSSTSIRRRALVAAVLAAVAATAAAPASPAGAPARSSVRAATTSPVAGADLAFTGGPDGVVRDATARGFVDDLLDAGAERRALTLEDVMRLHAERLGLVPLVGAEAGEIEETAAEDGTHVGVWPADDIDGDGAGDVYAVVDDANGLRTEARRGADGEILWTLDARDAIELIPMPVGDLDRDGVQDLLAWAFVGDASFRGSCLAGGCTFDYTADGAWRFGLASGRDGTVRWVREIPSEMAWHYEGRQTPAGYDAALTISGTEAWLAPSASHDLHGDAGAVVLERMHAIDGAFRYSFTGASGLAGRSTLTESLHIDASVSAVSADGTDVTELAAASGPIDLLVMEVDDLTGDGSDEVVVLEYTMGLVQRDCLEVVVEETCLRDDVDSVAGERLLVVDGAGQAVWSADLGDAYTWTATLGDVDGDGGTDLLVEDLYAGTATVRSGAAGAVVWSLTDIAAAVPAGDLDRDGVGDVVAIVDVTMDDGTVAATVARYAGRDGSPGAVRRHEQRYDDASELVYWVLGVWTDRQLDDDAGSDLVTTLVVADDQGQRGATTFERGADAADIAVVDTSAAFVVHLTELTGDGIDEAVVVPPFRLIVVCEIDATGEITCPEEAEPRDERIGALSLPALDPLWTWRPPAGAVWSGLLDAGDLDGLPGAELVEYRYHDGPDANGFTSGFVVRDGLDLTVRWGAGA